MDDYSVEDASPDETGEDDIDLSSWERACYEPGDVMPPCPAMVGLPALDGEVYRPEVVGEQVPDVIVPGDAGWLAFYDGWLRAIPLDRWLRPSSEFAEWEPRSDVYAIPGDPSPRGNQAWAGEAGFLFALGYGGSYDLFRPSGLALADPRGVAVLPIMEHVREEVLLADSCRDEVAVAVGPTDGGLMLHLVDGRDLHYVWSAPLYPIWGLESIFLAMGRVGGDTYAVFGRMPGGDDEDALLSFWVVDEVGTPSPVPVTTDVSIRYRAIRCESGGGPCQYYHRYGWMTSIDSRIPALGLPGGLGGAWTLYVVRANLFVDGNGPIEVVALRPDGTTAARSVVGEGVEPLLVWDGTALDVLYVYCDAAECGWDALDAVPAEVRLVRVLPDLEVVEAPRTVQAGLLGPVLHQARFGGGVVAYLVASYRAGSSGPGNTTAPQFVGRLACVPEP